MVALEVSAEGVWQATWETVRLLQAQRPSAAVTVADAEESLLVDEDWVEILGQPRMPQQRLQRLVMARVRRKVGFSMDFL